MIPTFDEFRLTEGAEACPPWVSPKDWEDLAPRGREEAIDGKSVILSDRFRKQVHRAAEAADLAKVIELMERGARTARAKQAVSELKLLRDGLDERVNEIVSSGFVWE